MDVATNWLPLGPPKTNASAPALTVGKLVRLLLPALPTETLNRVSLFRLSILRQLDTSEQSTGMHQATKLFFFLRLPIWSQDHL